MDKIIEQETPLSPKDGVSQYILGTLLFTPKLYIQHNHPVEIKVYKVGESHPSMKLFRLVHQLLPIASTPADQTEISIQDEVSILTPEGVDHMIRRQVNFSVHVKKDTLDFVQFFNEPIKLSEELFKSLEVFSLLSRQKGAQLYVGNDWRFVSDGEGWRLLNKHEMIVPSSEIKSLIPWV